MWETHTMYPIRPMQRLDAEFGGLLIDLFSVDHENHLLIFCQRLSRGSAWSAEKS
jgi:hypothetical protein